MQFSIPRSIAIARNFLVAVVSALLVLSVTAYAFSPSTEALAAKVAVVAAKPGTEAIRGRVTQGKKPMRGETVKVSARAHGKMKVIARVRVGRNGRFSVKVKPGRYTVVIVRGKKHVKTSVFVRKGRSVFIAVTVTRRSRGFSLTPVIFNY